MSINKASAIESETVEGLVDRIVFQSPDSGYTVMRISTRHAVGLATLVGNMAGIQPGESVRAQGKWVHNEKFGKQFQVEHYESVLPGTREGMEKYLASGLIRGIGPVYAGRIVARFGEETLNVLDKDIDRLRSVEGIGKKRLNVIKDAWNEHKSIHEIMVFLQSHNISSGLAVRIYNRFGRDSVGLVNENPYRLVSAIRGIGFQKADSIAREMGISEDADIRIDAAILYLLRELSGDGHTCYPRERLMQEMAKCFELNDEKVNPGIARMEERREIVVELADNGTEYIYPIDLHFAEVGAGSLILQILDSPRGLITIKADNAVRWYEENENIQLSERQADVVRAVAGNKIVVVTGGPGTGKTTVIKALTRIYSAKKTKILLAAPTGRAAKRMEEATGREASTVHKLLEFSPRMGQFTRDAVRPLEAELIVIDEVSMMDISLMYHLLYAVPCGATLVLVGDADQLPSVGPGDVLRDVIQGELDCERTADIPIRVVRLDQIFRQAEASHIVTNAHRINRGELPVLEDDVTGESPIDFFWVDRSTPEKALDAVMELVCDRIPNRFGLDPVEDIQVLSPMHRGEVGVINLNRELQMRVNSQPDQAELTSHRIGAGDKVIQLVNNYDKDVYNGEIGRVNHVDCVDQIISVDFDGREVAYMFREADDLSLAYAISIHKAQGSEFPAVVIPLVTQHYIMLYRNLLYTAITRGKKLVVLVGSRKALQTAVSRAESTQRYSRLSERLVSQWSA